MGPPDDDMSPLDPELRVKGVTGLRVADASVMPEHVTVNPNITVMMIGERCADLIRADLSRAGHTGAVRKEVELSPSFA
jgi:choline oxidase